MRRRHPAIVPRLWLMTDERIPDLLATIRALPRGSGIVFRHHATPLPERRRLFRQIRRLAGTRGLLLIRAGADRLPGEMGVHGRRGPGFISWPVHDRREARRAARMGADLLFVSPLFPTRSHPMSESIGPRRAMRIAQGYLLPTIALGGMTERRFRAIRARGFHGWAAIDALSR